MQRAWPAVVIGMGVAGCLFPSLDGFSTCEHGCPGGGGAAQGGQGGVDAPAGGEMGGGGSGGVGGAGGAMSPYEAAVLADEPLAYFRLGDVDDGSPACTDATGQFACDYRGNLTLGAPGATSDGDTAVKFSASNPTTEGVFAGDHFGFEGDAPFTFEYWARPQLEANHPNMVGYAMVGRTVKDADGEHGLYGATYYDMANDLWTAMFCRRENSPNMCAIGKEALPIDEYTYIAATFNAGTLSFYMNGEKQDAFFSSESSPVLDAGTEFRIGNITQFGSWGGLIDEVAIYDHALSETAIQAHYAAAFER